MKRRALLLAPLLVLASTSFARADDTSDLEGLLNESVVSTASKSAEVGTTAPATSTTITAEDLRRFGIHSLAEAIDFLSLGMVTSDSQHATDVGARGVMIPNDNADHVLLLVNGHAVNEPLFGAARFGRGAAIPMEMIDHIEVILGPGSVLYGANAMLGVVNVITKRAKDWTGVHVGGEMEPGKSWRVLGGAGVPFKFFGSDAEATLGVEYYKQDGPPLRYELEYQGIDKISTRPYRYQRGGPENGYWGGVARNGYYTRVPSGFLRLTLGNLEVNVHAKSFKHAAPYRSRYQHDFQDFDDPDSYETERHLWVDATHTLTLSPVVRFTTRAYADTWDWYSDVVSSEASACLSAGDSSLPACVFAGRGLSRWAGLELRGTFDWLQNDSFVTMIGVDGRLRHAGFKIDFLDYATRRHMQSSTAVIDRDERLLGAYGQQTWRPAKWLGLNAGARLDVQSRYDAVVSPRLAASLGTWTGGTLKGVYAEAFRTPSVVESDLEEQIQLLSQGLVPERVRSVEGSFEQKFGAQRILLGVFRTWWKDMIENHVLSQAEHEELVRQGVVNLYTFGVAQFRNVSTIDNYGFDAAYEGTLGESQAFRYGVNVTGAIARRNEPDVASRPLTVAPQVFGNARVAYDLPDDWPTIAVAGHYIGRRAIDRAFDGDWYGGTWTSPQLELRGTISGPVPKIKGLTYRASANFALDSRGPYVVGPAQNRDQWNPTPQLLPVDRFRTTIGLQYDLF